MNWKQAVSLGLCSVGEYKGEQWDTLFEGVAETLEDFVTSANGYSTKSLFVKEDGFSFSAGDIIRLTVDGVVFRYMCVENDSISITAGNRWLFMDDNSISDDGGNYLVWNFRMGNASYGYAYHLRFWSRTPGTYNVKIERKL